MKHKIIQKYDIIWTDTFEKNNIIKKKYKSLLLKIKKLKMKKLLLLSFMIY